MAQAARFAPIVHFHPAEPYLPCSVEYLLQNATLVDGYGRTLVTSPTQADIENFTTRPTRLLLDPAHYAGEPADEAGFVQAPMYVSVQVPPDRTFVDFNYLFLFGYNGAQTARVRLRSWSFNVELPHFAEHEGDIEGVTVRVAADFHAVHSVRTAAHGHAHDVLASDMTWQGDRPVVRAGLNSHATYDNGSAPWQVTTAMSAGGVGVDFVDLLDHTGAVWAPSPAQIVAVGVGTDGRAVGNQTWAAFGGVIGARWRNRYAGAQGLGGGATLAFWQRWVANVIAAAADWIGVTLLFADSDGTEGLRWRTSVAGAMPVQVARFP